MQHLGTCPLKTRRLYLRRFQLSDAPMVFNNWTSDEEVTRFVSWPTHRNVETTKQVLAYWTVAYRDLKTYQWAIVHQETQEVIGSVSLFNFHFMKSDTVHVCCELGYCLSKAYWNQGMMTEVAKAVIQFAFDELGVSCIKAKHDVLNQASGRVMQKVGMTYDGLVKKAALNGRRQWVDCETYRLFKTDLETLDD